MRFIEKIKEDADLSCGLEDRMRRLEDIHADALDLLSFCNSRVETVVEDSVGRNELEDLAASLAELHLCFTAPGTDFSEVAEEIMAIDDAGQRRAIAMLALSLDGALESLVSLEGRMGKRKLAGKRMNARAMRS